MHRQHKTIAEAAHAKASRRFRAYLNRQDRRRNREEARQTRGRVAA